MDVNVRRFEFVLGNTVPVRVGTVNEMAASADSFITSPSFPVADLSLAVHGGSLHRQRSAADRGPRKPRHRADFFLLSCRVRRKAGRAQKFLRGRLVHLDFGQGSIVRVFDGDLAADGADGALQGTNARLHRIALDDRPHAAVRKGGVGLRQAVGCKLFGE